MQLKETNGNGQQLAKRTTTNVEQPPTVSELMPIPPWLAAMRDAMNGAVNGEDIKKIMQVQIDKAKEGDMRAAQFVMNQAHKIMASEKKSVSIVQNNYYDAADPDKPIEPTDAEQDRIKKMRARARSGEPIVGREGDQRMRTVTDEEEKEIRRQQQAAEIDDTTGPEGD